MHFIRKMKVNSFILLHKDLSNASTCFSINKNNNKKEASSKTEISKKLSSLLSNHPVHKVLMLTVSSLFPGRYVWSCL